MPDKKITLLDGGMGQELLARSKSVPSRLWSTKILLEEPHLVESVHDDYFAVGADIATAATYPIHRDRLVADGHEDKFESLHRDACIIANRSRDKHGKGLVAGAVGPIGWSYCPELTPDFEFAAETYAEIARIQADYVDFYICETVASVKHAEGALAGMSVTGKPVWLALTVDDSDGSKLRSGEPLSEIFPLLKKYAPAALLINCSVPEAVSVGLPALIDFGLPVGAYANGFREITAHYAQAGTTVDELSTREDLSPSVYADFAADWIKDGATIVGGCCEVGPSHIAEIAQRFA